MNGIINKLNNCTKYLLFVSLLTFSFFSLLLALISINNNEIWVDEIYSIVFSSSSQKAVHHNILNPDKHYPIADYDQYLDSKLSVSALIDIPKRLSAAGETHPPLYYLTLNLWSALFGHSKIAIRALSLIFAILSLTLAFRIGHLMHGPRFGFMLTSMFALSFHFLHHLTIARMHILTLLLTLCCLYYFLRQYWPHKFKKNPPPKNIYVLSFFLALGCLNTFLFIHVCIAVATATLLFERSFKTFIKTFSIPFVTFTIFLIAGGYQQIQNIPYNDFTAQNLTFINFIEDSIIRLAPLESLYRSSTTPQLLTILILAISLLVPLFTEKHQRKVFISFSLVPILTTLFVDIILGSSLATWSEGRAVNYLVVGLALAFAITIYQTKNFALNIFTTYLIYAVFVGNAWHAQHYFFTPGISFEQMKTKVSKNFEHESSILFLTDTNQSYHVPMKLLIYFKDYQNSDIFHLQDLEDKDKALPLIEKSEFIVYLSHPFSQFSQVQKDQLKQWLTLKGHRLEFSFPSRGVWGPWDDYHWYLLSRDQTIQ